MKQIVSVMLVCILIFSLAGCGIGKKAEEKTAEALAEKAMEQGGAKDVDIDGDTMTIKGADGQEVTISNKWPDSELGKSIPEFEKGRIDGTVETSISLMLTLYEVKQEDAAAYIKENKPNFPLDNTEMSAEGMISWGGTNEAGLRLALTHQDDCLSIILTKEEKEK